MCKAIRVNEQYHCHACGYQWDVQDEDRPVCKPTKNLRGFIAGVMMVSVAGCVEAADKACDATRAAMETHIVLANIDSCYETAQRFGSVIASTSTSCNTVADGANRYAAEVATLVVQGCTSYYNGPSTAERARLTWYSERFGELAK